MLMVLIPVEDISPLSTGCFFQAHSPRKLAHEPLMSPFDVSFKESIMSVMSQSHWKHPVCCALKALEKKCTGLEKQGLMSCIVFGTLDQHNSLQAADGCQKLQCIVDQLSSSSSY